MIANLPTLVEDARVEMVKQRSKLQRLNNPSKSHLRSRSNLFKALIKGLGETSGKAVWLTYVNTCKREIVETREAYDQARLYLRYLKSIQRLQEHAKVKIR